MSHAGAIPEDRPPTFLGDQLGALLLPVSLDGAIAWAAGEITDDQLAEECSMEPGAVFAVDLRDRAGWRAGMDQARFWWTWGARYIVTGTRVPLLIARYRRAGMVATSVDDDGRVRMAADAPNLGRYLWRYFAAGRSPHQADAAAGVVSSR